jgi:hypothetical protein
VHGEIRTVYKILVGKPEGRRQLGRFGSSARILKSVLGK